MDTFFFGNPATNIRNGIIEEISSANNNTFVTVSRTNCPGCRRGEENTIRLVVGNNTIILNENGNPMPVRNLRVGMTVNASFSSAMTRSIPPQASAYIIQVIRRPLPDNTTVGRIVDIDRQNRSFTTVSDGNLSSIIRFNVPQNALIFDRFGRPMTFSRLTPGLRVWVRHAAFMTASIPPQTTAFEIRVR